jgi:hypothetical protein
MSGQTFRIPISNGIFEHCPTIGDAIWYFMWLIDKTTKETVDGDGTGNFIGTVRGGMPCRDADAASTCGVSIKTVMRWRHKLAKAGFIETKRTPTGYSIKVYKSKKWVSKRVDKNVLSLPEVTGQKCPITPGSDWTKMSYHS